MTNPQVCLIKKAVAAPGMLLEEQRDGIEMLLLHLNSPFNEQVSSARPWSKWKAGAGTIFHLE